MEILEKKWVMPAAVAGIGAFAALGLNSSSELRSMIVRDVIEVARLTTFLSIFLVPIIVLGPDAEKRYSKGAFIGGSAAISMTISAVLLKILSHYYNINTITINFWKDYNITYNNPLI